MIKTLAKLALLRSSDASVSMQGVEYDAVIESCLNELEQHCPANKNVIEEWLRDAKVDAKVDETAVSTRLDYSTSGGRGEPFPVVVKRLRTGLLSSQSGNNNAYVTCANAAINSFEAEYDFSLADLARGDSAATVWMIWKRAASRARFIFDHYQPSRLKKKQEEWLALINLCVEKIEFAAVLLEGCNINSTNCGSEKSKAILAEMRDTPAIVEYFSNVSCFFLASSHLERALSFFNLHTPASKETASSLAKTWKGLSPVFSLLNIRVEDDDCVGGDGEGEVCEICWMRPKQQSQAHIDNLSVIRDPFLQNPKTGSWCYLYCYNLNRKG